MPQTEHLKYLPCLKKSILKTSMVLRFLLFMMVQKFIWMNLVPSPIHLKQLHMVQVLAHMVAGCRVVIWLLNSIQMLLLLSLVMLYQLQWQVLVLVQVLKNFLFIDRVLTTSQFLLLVHQQHM